MKCKNCGASISQSMNYCQYCGSEVDLLTAGSKEAGDSRIGSGQATSSQVQNETDISNQALVDSRTCPRCQARVPLSSITIMKKAPNVGQWILAGLLGFLFIVMVLLLQPLGIFIMVDFLVILLWAMFTRRFWICPACHQKIKIKRNLWQFKQDWYQNIR